MRPQRFHTLEVSLRIRSHSGVLLSEHVIRGQQVELINYFPSGKIDSKIDVTLEQFVEGLQELQLSADGGGWTEMGPVLYSSQYADD